MLIVITANGPELDSHVNPRFNRCQNFIFYDTELKDIVDVVDNPELEILDGGGQEAGQVIVGHDAEAILTGRIDPEAGDILAAGGVAVYLCEGGTVESAIRRFLAGQLILRPGPDRGFHSGPGSAETMRARPATPGSDPGREETDAEVVGAEVECMCVMCGHTEPHEAGSATACEDQPCPRCGALMITHSKVE